MDYSIESGPSNSVLEITLSAGEQIVSEAGAMAWMSSNIQIETGARGGIMSSLSRSVLGGESFFQNTYSAVGESGQIGLTPGQPGQVIAYEMRGGELLLEKDAYLASEPSVELNTDFQGLRGLFNEGMFILRASGSGMLFFDAMTRESAAPADTLTHEAGHHPPAGLHCRNRLFHQPLPPTLLFM